MVYERELQMATGGAMGRLRRRDAGSATARLQMARLVESFKRKNRLILAAPFWSHNFLRYLRVVGNLSGILAACSTCFGVLFWTRLQLYLGGLVFRRLLEI